MKSWKKIKVLLDPRKNFAALRALHDTPPDPSEPRIITSGNNELKRFFWQFQVLYLRDLTFLDEGCKDFEDGDLNYWKMQNLGKLLERISHSQHTKYNFPRNEAVALYLTGLVPLDTDEVIELKSKKLRDYHESN